MVATSSGILDNDTWEQAKLNFESKDASQRLWQTSWKPAAKIGGQGPIAGRIYSWIWRQLRHRPKNLHPTAYLDGLRGFAALLVYWHHHELWFHSEYRLNQNSIFENSFGYEGNYHLVAFPYVRTLFSGGHYAVSAFFVLSGYVLSIKPLHLVEKNDLVGLGDHLASAFFRRWLRLFLPVALTTFLYATCWHVLGIWVDGARPKSTWPSELWSFYTEFKNFSFVYKEGGDPWLSYHYHVWSIPVELRGSMVVFASLLAFSRCTLSARLWCQMAITGYFLYIADGWYCAMFTAGMLLSQLDLLAKTSQLPDLLARLKPYKSLIYHHLLALSIYLGGVPSENRDLGQLARNRGWYYLSYLKPQAVFDYKWFYLFWAAVFLVASVSHISWLRKFFETRICQYLGRVSYAFYLVHGPLLWTIGDRLYMAVGVTSKEAMEHVPHWADKLMFFRGGPVGLEVSFLLPHLILLPLTLLLAEFVTKAIDGPSVRITGWLYRKMIAKAPTQHTKA